MAHNEYMSEDLAELCGETSIWPVRFNVSGKTGYTLWGARNSVDDIFLVKDRKVIAYPSLGTMIASLSELGNHSFSRQESYRRFLELAPLTLWRPANPEYQVPGYDFDFVARALAEADMEHQPFGSKAVECLDAAYDLAIQLNESTMHEALRSREHPLGRLYYSAWGEDQLSGDAFLSVRAAFNDLIAWVDERMVFIKA